MTRLTKRAKRDLDDLPKKMRQTGMSIIERLDEEPALGKKLLGKLEGKRSARLGRSHRIIYEVNDGEVVVLTISARKDAYR